MNSKTKRKQPKHQSKKVPTVIEIPLHEIDTAPCVDRRGEPLAQGGMASSIEVAGQTSLALVAPEKKQGKWQLLDGRRIFEALKANGDSTILAEVADRDPVRAQLQIVHRHNVMPHSASAKVRMLVQWRAAYESLYPRALKHGGDRRKQARTDAAMSFGRMAAAEWKTTPSTIGRYLKLEDASADVLRGLDNGQLTLSEAGMLAGKAQDEHVDVLATKASRKRGAQRAEAEAIERSQTSEQDRLWEALRSLAARLLALYPDADPDRVEQLAGTAWLDELTAILDPALTTSKKAA